MVLEKGLVDTRDGLLRFPGDLSFIIGILKNVALLENSSQRHPLLFIDRFPFLEVVLTVEIIQSCEHVSTNFHCIVPLVTFRSYFQTY